MTVVIAAGMAFARDDAGSRRAKARHYFLAGAIREAQGEPAEAYELYRKAWLSDTTYREGAYYYGLSRLMAANETLSSEAEAMRSLAMARGLVDQYPADNALVLQYAYLASALDTAPEAIRVLSRYDSLQPGNSATLSGLVRVYEQGGMVDSALQTTRRLERLEGISFQTTLNKLRYHLMKADTTAGIDELSLYMRENPRSTEPVVLKGKVFSMLGMPDSAFRYLEQAERLDPDDGVVKNELAMLYAEQGDSVSYDRKTYEALTAENLDLDVKINILSNYISRLLQDKADPERGKALFEMLTGRYPHEPSLLELNARYASSLGDYPQAVESIGYAIDLDPTNVEYRTALATYQYLAKNYDDALATCRAVEEQFPDVNLYQLIMLENGVLYEKKDDEGVIANYGRLLSSISDLLKPDEALTSLSGLASLDIYQLYQAATAYQGIGDAYYRLEDLPHCYAAYDNALRLYPDMPLTLNNYAYFLVEKGGARPGSEEFDKAVTMSRKAVELTSSDPNPTYLDTYAWILYLNGELTDAEAYMLQALELVAASDDEDADNAEYHRHYGDILEAQERHEEAVAEWKKALEIDADDAVAKERLKGK